MSDALCKWLAKHLLLLLIFSLQPRSLIFSEQRVCLPQRLRRVAACSVMCNSDEIFASNVLGSDWVKESAEAPTSARCDEILPASLGRRAPPASRKERRWGPAVRGDGRTAVSCAKSRKYRRRQNAQYLSAQRPGRQFKLRSISCLAFHPRLSVRVPCFTQWVSHVLLYAHIYSLYLPT